MHVRRPVSVPPPRRLSPWLAGLLLAACGGGGGAQDTVADGGGGAGGVGGAVVPDAGPTPFVADELVEVGLTVPADAWAALVAAPESDTQLAATLDWGGETLTQVGLGLRGSGSLLDIADAGSDRFHFKLDLNDLVPEQSLYGEKKLYLNHGYKDPTQLREVLAYRFMHRLGVPSPRAALVHVTLNGASMGIYTAVEAVDGGFVEERFPDPDGSLYGMDDPAGTLQVSTDEPPTYEGLEVERGEPAEPAPADFLALIQALAPGGAGGFEALLDIDATLRYLAAQVALVNLDSYLDKGRHYFLYGQTGVFTPIPWDVGDALALGTCGCPAQTLIDFPVDAPTCGPLAERPLLAAVLATPALVERYHVHLSRAADALEDLATEVPRLAELVRPVLADDDRTLFSFEDFEWALTQDLARETDGEADVAAPIFGLTRFLTARAASIRAQLADPTTAGADAEGACP